MLHIYTHNILVMTLLVALLALNKLCIDTPSARVYMLPFLFLLPYIYPLVILNFNGLGCMFEATSI